MRESGEKIYGSINIRGIGSDIEWIDFIDGEGKKKPYRGDVIIEFSHADNIYRCFKYCGWAKLITKGAINLYKGSICKGFGMSRYCYDCFAFKKGKEPAIFIAADEIKLFSGINNGILTVKSKDSFKEYISDNLEILDEFENENFRFLELVPLIAKYNALAKNKQ